MTKSISSYGFQARILIIPSKARFLPGSNRENLVSMLRHVWQNRKFMTLRQQTSSTNSVRISAYLDQFLESNNRTEVALLGSELLD